MDCQKLIAAAQEALGGIERIKAIRTYHAVMRRMHNDGRTATVSLWRAAGGRIRVEECAPDRTELRVANAAASTFGDAERAELLRDARIAPRNMLAHAAEHRLAMRSRPAPDGSRIVSYPTEFVLYLFNRQTFLCTKMIDLSRHRRIEFRDYRVVDGIATPFAEKHVFADDVRFDDAYVRIEYNLDLAEGLFEH
jgi:hypothetical protein